MSLKNSKFRHGITLIELMVVVAIIGVLVGIAIPTFRLLNSSTRTSAAVSAAEGFIAGVMRDAHDRNGATLYLERNNSDTRLVSRLFKGKRRRNYRGEDETSYAVRGADYNTSVGSFHTFWLYNVNPQKILPTERIKFDGYEGWFIIIQRVDEARGAGSVPTSMNRPVSVVLCLPEREAFNSGRDLQRNHQFMGATSRSIENQSTIKAETQLDFAGMVGQAEADRPDFWPSIVSLPQLKSLGYEESRDFPRFQNGKPIRNLGFEVTRDPKLVETEFYEFPDGSLIDLRFSGLSGSSTANHGVEVFSQIVDMSSRGVDVNVEQTDLGNPVRKYHFPRIDFDSDGNIARVFAPSLTGYQYYDALHTTLDAHTGNAAHAAVPGYQIPRLIPFSPRSPIGFLVGDVQETERVSNPPAGITVVRSGDHWLFIFPVGNQVTSGPAEIRSTAMESRDFFLE